MSAPEGLINRLYRAGNLRDKDIQSILTSFQAVPKQVDEDTDLELIIYAPEIRQRIDTITVNPGGTNPLAETRDRTSAKGYIRELPKQVKIYPSTHILNGTLTFPKSDLKFGGAAEFNNGAYITESNSARFNPTDKITIAGWLKLPATESGDDVRHILGKTDQYGLFVDSHSNGTNQVYAQVTIGSTNYQSVRYTYTPDTWFHIYYLWTNLFALYVNNSLIGSGIAIGSLDTTTNPFSIGADHIGANAVKDGTTLSNFSMIHSFTDLIYLNEHYNGVLNLAGVHEEIVTFPFAAHDRPITDCSVGRCQVNKP